MTHLKRLAVAVVLGMAVTTGFALPAEAHVHRVEKRDHKREPARVQYIEKVRIYKGSKIVKRYVYIELFNGATFRVNHCKRPVRVDMHIKTVRRLCGRK